MCLLIVNNWKYVAETLGHSVSEVKKLKDKFLVGRLITDNWKHYRVMTKTNKFRRRLTLTVEAKSILILAQILQTVLHKYYGFLTLLGVAKKNLLPVSQPSNCDFNVLSFSNNIHKQPLLLFYLVQDLPRLRVQANFFFMELHIAIFNDFMQFLLYLQKIK